MTKSPLSLTLLATAAGLSFCALPTLADTHELADGEYTIASDNGSTTWAGDTFVISSNILNAENWGEEGYLGAWIGWSNDGNTGAKVGTADAKVTITGSGFFGIAFRQGNGNPTIDLTNVDVSNFTGQICIVNQYNGSATVALSGEQWAGVEYVFGSVTAEWAGVTTAETGAWEGTNGKSFPGLFTRGAGSSNTGTNYEHDTLALQGDTTLAGITGTSKGYTVGSNNFASEDAITVTTAGTELTIAGSGTYAFYGTVGASGTEVSLVMDSKNGDVAASGKQTFGGTNYLKDVTVTAGTLVLDGTTSITGGVSVATGSALELGGTVTLASAIQNSGSVTVADSTTFVLDNITAIYDVSTNREYYELIISTDNGSLIINDLNNLGFTIGGETIGWTVYETNGSLYIYSAELASKDLTWSGTSSTNTWTTDSSVTDWTISNTTTSTSFATGDSVTFGPSTSSFSNTIILGEDITASTVTISGTGYTLEAGNGSKLTASEIILDDEESGTNHTFTITQGVTVEAGSLTESAGQLDLVVNGELNVTGNITINTTATSTESISGTGKFTVGSLTLNPASNSTLTIAVSTVEIGSVSIVNSNSSGNTRTIVFGSDTIATSATISGSLALNGAATVQITKNSTLTVGSVTDTSGYSTSISGEGTLIADEITFAGNQGNTFTISVADLQVGTFTKNAHNSSQGSIVFSGGSATIGEFYVNATGSITFTGEGTYNIGSYVQSSGATSGTTFAIGDNTTVIMGSYSAAWHEDRSFGTNSALTVTGVFALGTGDYSTESFSGATVSVGTMNLYNHATVEFSNGALYIGSGGIISEGANSGWDNCSVTFGDGLTVGVYAGTDESSPNTSWSTDAKIIFSGTTTGTTFSTNAGEQITLSGSLSGTGFTNTGSGTLTLSGSIDFSSEIKNSGTLEIDASSVTFALDNLTLKTDEASGKSYYEIVVNDGGSITFTSGTELSLGNFTIDGASLADSGWNLYTDDNYGAGIYIYNSSQNLVWAGTSGNNTWTVGSTEWTSTSTFTSGDNVTFAPISGETSSSVVLGSDITAGTVTITGSGYELSGNYTLTATELVLDDEEYGTGHTFTIAEGTTVEVEKFTEDVGQMDLIINGNLGAKSMHIDSSESEVISGSGSLMVNSFTYDATQGSSLTISVANASFSTLYEQPSGSDSNTGDYRKLIIGSEDGNIPDGAEYSTEVAVGTEFVLAGKSEIQVNKNSELSIGSLIDSSECDTKISGEGSLLANSATFGGNGEVTISIASFDVGDITFSNSGKLTISSSNYFLAYTAAFSNSGNITIAEGANVIIGEATITVSQTITVEEGATFTVGSLDRARNQLTLVVNGTMNVEKDLQVDEYYEGSTSGLLSFGDSTEDSKTSYAQTLSGTGTVNAYGLETNLSSGSLTISVANLNIGEGGITEYGHNGIHIAGTTIGLYNTTKLTLSVPLIIDSAGATFNTNEGEELTLSGAITGNGMVTKTGEGELVFTGTGSSLTNGLTVSAGTLSVAANASLTIGGTIDLSSAIQNSGSITIAEGASIVVGVEKQSGEYSGATYDYYELITGSDGASVTLNGSVIFVIGDDSVTLNSLLQRYADSDTWNIYSEGGYLVIYEATSDEKPANIYWAGSDGNSTIWVAGDDSTIDWSDSDGGEAVYSFADGDAVIFGSAAESKTVAVSGTVAPGSITINGEYTFNKDTGAEEALVQTSELTIASDASLTIGSDVTVQITETLTGFSVDGKIEGTGTLEITLTSDSYGTINLGTENGFAGIVYVTSGGVTLNGSNIGEGTYQLADGVNMQVTSSGVEVGNNFILEGTSQVHVNSSDSLTISGNISGVETDGVMGGTFDRQGAGSLTISGNVDIGTFVIDSSGSGATSSTTFSGSSVTIGTLDVTYAESVVFSGGAESSLNIGKLTFEAAGVIEFQNGGSIGTISYDKQSSSGIIRVSGGTLEVGTITNTYTDVQTGNETLTKIQVGADAVLHAETITIAPGNAGSVYSTISGIESGGAGTVIADTLNIGASGGASVEVSDVTLIVGSLNYASNGNGSNYNLFLNNATLGFTNNTEVKSTTGSDDTSRLVLGGFASGNSTATGSGTTTTINTSKYDVETGAFTSTGVTVTISQIISGQGALVVDGVGKLILDATNTYSGGTTIKAGATVVVENSAALGTGSVSVANGATLELDTSLAVTGSTVIFTAGASIVLGGDLLQEIIESVDTQVAVAVITASDISFGDKMASDYGDDSDGLTEIVNQYVTSNQYGIIWSWSEGTLWAVATIPEPSMFGVIFGFGALGLVATRRRRRKAA